MERHFSDLPLKFRSDLKSTSFLAGYDVSDDEIAGKTLAVSEDANGFSNCAFFLIFYVVRDSGDAPGIKRADALEDFIPPVVGKINVDVRKTAPFWMIKTFR
jgi:hypothetical protein